MYIEKNTVEDLEGIDLHMYIPKNISNRAEYITSYVHEHRRELAKTSTNIELLKQLAKKSDTHTKFLISLNPNFNDELFEVFKATTVNKQIFASIAKNTNILSNNLSWMLENIDCKKMRYRLGLNPNTTDSMFIKLRKFTRVGKLYLLLSRLDKLNLKEIV